ncbi:MAG: hypothetical protein ACXW3E_12975, partial [Thermoanaerobaculia bacterium]
MRRAALVSLRRIILAISVGFLVQVLGSVFLAAGNHRVAEVLTIYPSSYVFYLIPQGVIDHLPEVALFFIGFGGGVLVWASRIPNGAECSSVGSAQTQ